MAIWTVNTTADDGSVDTNPDSPTYRTGSLRGIIGAAASGDTIVFDTSVFKPSEETSIAIDSIINLPARNIVIDAIHNANGEEISGATWTDAGVFKTRVVIDGQSVAGIFYTYTASYCNVAGVTFRRGNANAGGAIRSRATVSNSYTFCVFDSCNGSNNGGALYLGSNSTNNIVNCVFKDCTSPLGASIWISGSIDNGSSLNIYNCVFYDTSSNYNIYISTTACPLVINDSLTVDKIYIINGASVTFSGVDSILAVTTTATIGSATFTAAANSTGYAAFPAGTNISAATFTGVKNCTYGAGVTSVHASENGVEWTAANISTNVLIEQKTGSTWTTLTNSGVNGAYSTPLAVGDVVRIFDGVNFLVDAFVVPPDYWRVFNYAANTNGGGTDSDGNRIGAWSVESYALATNGGGYDPDSGSDLPGWTVANYALTPNLEGAGNENQ